MQKIVCLFQGFYEGDRQIFDLVAPGAEWVLAGEGWATLKIDGSCCLVRDGCFYKRYDAKHGKTPPTGFVPAQETPDPVTGHWPGWIAVCAGPADRWHREAWENWLAATEALPPDGTYELVGPKVQNNAEGEEEHILIAHGEIVLDNVPRTFEGLRQYLTEAIIEGIVFYHEDGRRAKIRRRDYGLAWPVRRAGVDA